MRVNAICPGLIETGMTKPIFDMARAPRGSEGKIGQLNPLTRYGVPDEIAAMALFLASDEPSYVNGQAIAVDGGFIQHASLHAAAAINQLEPENPLILRSAGSASRRMYAPSRTRAYARSSG